jgi:hypothetical protein
MNRLLVKKINRENSSIMFSPNTGQEIRSRIKSDLSIDSEAMSERYLGLPISIEKSKKAVFEYIKRRFGAGFRVGRKNFYQKLVRKSLLRLLRNLFPLMLCHVLTLQKVLVMTSV